VLHIAAPTARVAAALRRLEDADAVHEAVLPLALASGLGGVDSAVARCGPSCGLLQWGLRRRLHALTRIQVQHSAAAGQLAVGRPDWTRCRWAHRVGRAAGPRVASHAVLGAGFPTAGVDAAICPGVRALPRRLLWRGGNERFSACMFRICWGAGRAGQLQLLASARPNSCLRRPAHTDPRAAPRHCSSRRYKCRRLRSACCASPRRAAAARPMQRTWPRRARAGQPQPQPPRHANRPQRQAAAARGGATRVRLRPLWSAPCCATGAAPRPPAAAAPCRPAHARIAGVEGRGEC
jgi:hypothetical protein